MPNATVAFVCFNLIVGAFEKSELPHTPLPSTGLRLHDEVEYIERIFYSNISPDKLRIFYLCIYLFNKNIFHDSDIILKQILIQNDKADDDDKERDY